MEATKLYSLHRRLSTAHFPFVVTVLIALLVLGYFFHGVGWNQNATFALMRSLVERGTADITPFASQTGDISRWNGHIYAAKPPGLALLGAPIYWMVLHVQRALGINSALQSVELGDLYLMTILLSAVPASLVAGMLVIAFGRAGARRRDAMSLAGAFAFGSLLLPYAGVLMSHSMVTAALLGAWLLVTARPASATGIFWAGILLGIAGLCDYYAGLVGAAYILYLLLRRVAPRRIALLVIGPVMALGAIVAFNRFAYGQYFVTGYSHQAAQFRDSHLLLGVFGWPDPRRLYWITFQRMRGLFVTCPVFDLAILSLLAAMLRRRWRFTADDALACAIIGWFCLFELSFIGWTGGWCVGPRYLSAALPILFLYGRSGFDRFRKIAWLLIIVSIIQMFAVTAVNPLFPANEQGPPQYYDPVGSCMISLLQGKIAQTDGATNIGLLLGLPGRWSLLPPALLIMGYFGLARRASSGEISPPVGADTGCSRIGD